MLPVNKITVESGPQSLDCLKIQDSPVGSYGVFTSEDLQELTCVEIAKAIIFPRDVYHQALYVTMANGFEPKDLIIDQYTIGWGEKKVCIPLGNIGMYNHSDNPNCEFIKLSDKKCVGMVTIKKVKAGEELTVSYGLTWFKNKDYVKQISL